MKSRNVTTLLATTITFSRWGEADEQKEENIAAQVPGRCGCRRSRIYDCVKERARTGIHSTERHPEHCRDWRWRNGPHEFDQSRKPKHRGAMRRGLGIRRQSARSPGRRHPEA